MAFATASETTTPTASRSTATPASASITEPRATGALSGTAGRSTASSDSIVATSMRYGCPDRGRATPLPVHAHGERAVDDRGGAPRPAHPRRQRPQRPQAARRAEALGERATEGPAAGGRRRRGGRGVAPGDQGAQ